MTSQAVGLGAAVDYLQRRSGMEAVSPPTRHALTGAALRRARRRCPGVRIIGPRDLADRGGAVSFVVDGVHAHDVGQVLDDAGVAGAGRAPLRVAAAPPLRGGRHRPGDLRACTTPPDEVDALVDGGARGPASSSGWAEPCSWSSCTRRSSWTTTGRRTAPACASRSTPRSHHVNPTCGDEVTLRVRARRRPTGTRRRSRDVSYETLGCSISQASTSVLTDLVVGRPVTEVADGARRRSRRWCSGRGTGRAGRGRARRRRRLRRGGPVPGAGEVRAAGLDGVQGRRRPGVQARSASRGEGRHDRQRDRPTTTERRRPRGAAGMPEPPPRTAGRRRPCCDDLEEAMRDVVDPELGINVVDLGLVYGLARRRRRHRHDRHDADLGGLPADRRDRGPGARGADRPTAAWSTTSGSTGSGCRRGARRRSPTTAASSCARWASTSDRCPGQGAGAGAFARSAGRRAGPTRRRRSRHPARPNRAFMAATVARRSSRPVR